MIIGMEFVMSMYKSKPKIIEAVEFDPLIICYYGKEYQIFDILHSQWLSIEPGDMIRIDNPLDHYPIAIYQWSFNLKKCNLV